MADLRSTVAIEVKKNERTYVFYMPVGAPLGEVYDAAFEVLQEIVTISKKAVEQAKPQDISSESK